MGAAFKDQITLKAKPFLTRSMKTAFVYLLVASAFVAASPAAQSLCAACPPADNNGDTLVAASGGTLGVPKFCG